MDTADSVPQSGYAGRFPPALERRFQQTHYSDVRGTHRGTAAFLAVLFLAYAIRTIVDGFPLSYVLAFNVPLLLMLALIGGLTYAPRVERWWQPIVVVLCWIGMGLALQVLAAQLARMAAHPPPTEVFFDPVAILGNQFPILLVSAATFRVGFRWSIALYGGLLAIVLAALIGHLCPVLPAPERAVWLFLQPAPFTLFALLVLSRVQEALARRTFHANWLLDQERSEERRKRLHTEETLGVLGQAIGTIAHDLGSPLTIVQTGAALLETFVENGTADEETVKEFTGDIKEGARTLNYLRLSLMEQTRVLEGKPIPVELRPVALRRIVELGARYQTPRFRSGRQIVTVGEDLQVHADETKLTTVLMNLIGNALKYSDGEVQVTWREHEGAALVAVLDQGCGGQGLTAEQAHRLFVPFGRLETHAEVEGTGLGLLSVRRIVEAHGGEAFIEGHVDGTSDASNFGTARGSYPSVLEPPFRTAFVITCPLAAVTSPSPGAT